MHPLKPQPFNYQCFIDAANELARLDEVERALWVLNNLPAYFRDHPIPEVNQLKNEIMARICTPSRYAQFGSEDPISPESALAMRGTLRGSAMVSEVKRLNEMNLKPHVVDYGPGGYWLSVMLASLDCLFTYKEISLTKPPATTPTYWAPRAMPEQPIVFFAGEIIEHLWNENEIRIEMLRHCGLADIIHISTPKYTYDYTCPDWRLREDLGHLRAYTPKEFYEKVCNMFPEYEPILWDDTILHARLLLKNNRFGISSKNPMEARGDEELRKLTLEANGLTK